MGPRDSPHSVVDSELRVIGMLVQVTLVTKSKFMSKTNERFIYTHSNNVFTGTKRLRVIDAGIMPTVVSKKKISVTLDKQIVNNTF